MTFVRKAKSARRILVAACGAVLATSVGASAAVQTWTGGSVTNDNWTNADNWLGNTAPVAGDALIFDGTTRLTPSNDFAALTSFTGIGFLSTAGAFTLNGNAITLSGDLTSDSSGQTHTINLGLALDANRTVRVSDSNMTINGVISGTGFGITKAGNGTLTLGAVNTYTGPTVIDGGTLSYTADNLGVGALNFGITPAANSASTTSSTLDLTSASLTATSLNVQTNSVTPNVIGIGTDKTLTVNGAFIVGVPEVYAESVSGPITNLNVSGNTLVVNGGAGHFIANLGRSNAKSDTDPRVTIDMTSLSNFTYTGTTGEFRVGAGNGRATVTLANSSNSITAAQIRIGDTTATSSGDNNGGAGPRSTIHLGGGSNVLAANTFIIGNGKSAGALDFLSTNGTLTITGEAGGASTANITVGSSTSGTGTNDESQLLLAGHDVTVQVGNLVLGRLAGGSAGSPGSARGNATFDTGTFNANSIQLGVNSSGSAPGTNGTVARGTLTVGGPFAGSGATGVLNVSNQFFLANRTNSNAAAMPSEGRFIINGATANINTDILDASTTFSNAGPNVTTLTLDGGTLNIGAHNIGAYTAPITTINLNSGTYNGTGRVAATTINVSSAVTLTGSPTFVLSNAGTLVSNAPVLTLNSGGGVEGGGSTTGSVFGDVLADTGSHIAPGSATVPATLQFQNALTLNNGSTVKFKLSDNPGSGNDVVNTNVLNLSGTVNLDISPLGLGPQGGNVYTLFTYVGLTGDETNFTILGNTTRSTYSILPTASTPGSIQMSVVGGGPLSLIWVGNNGDAWDVIQTTNWKDALTNLPQKFFSGDQVLFDDSSTNVNPVQIAAQVSPGSVRVSAARDYNFAGAGGIAGTGNLTKELAGTLTLTTNNTYSGTTDINGGTLRVGNGGTTGTTGTGTININNGTLVFNRSNALTVANAINGPGNVVQSGAGAITLSGASSYQGGTAVNNGALKVTSNTGAGSGAITVNSPGILVTGANLANPITLNGSVLGASANSTLSGDLTVTATGVTIRGADPTNLPTAAADVNNIAITGTLSGSANISVLSNGQDNNPDAGNGVRLQQSNAATSTYSGTITVANSVKFELQTSQAGPFSPAGTGKIVMTAGDATLGTALTTVTRAGGYSELNLRNNSTGDTVVGNDISIAGSGLAVLNPLGSAPEFAKISMGQLSIGSGQELATYLANSTTVPTHAVAFSSVTLNGTATFSPKKPGLGADNSFGGDIFLGPISETVPSGINVSGGGARALVLTANNNYTGPTQVNSGTLRVTNTTGSATGSGAVSVASGATLSGTGIITGAVTANANSHVAPGVGGVGTLTLGSLSLTGASNLDFQGLGSSFDLLNVTSNNGLTFGGNATLNLVDLQPDSFSAGDYTLIDYAGAPIGNLNGKLTLSNTSFVGGSLVASLIDDAASTSIKLHLAQFVPGPPQWNVDGDGSWTVGSNWNPAIVPDGASNGATFLGIITAPHTVTLDGDRTIGTLAFDNANKYTIAQGSGGTLTIGDSANPGSVSVVTGSHEISAPVNIGSAASVDVDNGAALALSGGVSIGAGNSLTKSGNGTLRISGSQLHQPGATLTQTQGTLRLDSNAGTTNSAAGSNLILKVAANASGGNSTVLLNSDQDLKDLNVSFNDSGTQTFNLNSSAAAGAFRSVRVYADNLQIAKAGLAAAIRNANAAGAADHFDGIIDSGLHTSSGIGIAIQGDHVLIRPTRIGDLNLDGQVTISDFIDLASNFNAINKTWQEGDLNNDGAVTISDFIDLASNFNSSYAGSIGAANAADLQTLASFASSLGVDPSVIGSAVPEPASLSLLSIGAAAFLRRRRNPKTHRENQLD